MNGWIEFKGEEWNTPGHFSTAKTEPADKMQTSQDTAVSTAWPPKFTLFTIKTAISQLAFTDSRKLAKLRLVRVPPGVSIKNVPPLSSNGPDAYLAPLSIDKWKDVCAKKKTTVKALLMDQSFMSGLGNWMVDDCCLAGKIHPSKRTDTLTEDDIRSLITGIKTVCEKSVSVGGQSSKFPDNWIFHIRWGRRKAGETVRLRTGEEVDFADGGRTTVYVPSIQGRVEGDGGGEKRKRGAAGAKKGKAGAKAVKKEEEDEDELEEEKPQPKKRATKPSAGKKAVKKEEEEDDDEQEEDEEEEEKPQAKKRGPTKSRHFPDTPSSPSPSPSSPSYDEADSDFSQESDGSDFGAKSKKKKKTAAAARTGARRSTRARR